MNIDSFVYLERVRTMAFSLPEVTEKLCFGTPAFYVQKKLIARLKEDGETLVVYTDDRDIWIKAKPAIYFVTDHYRNYPMMLVRLVKVSKDDLQTLLKEAWRMRAGKRLLKEEGERGKK